MCFVADHCAVFSSFRLVRRIRCIGNGSTATSLTIGGAAISEKICPFSLGGEIDTNRGWKPDFLVHIPGQMTNLVILEVKPGNAAAIEGSMILRS
jgi:hypothetical protein